MRCQSCNYDNLGDASFCEECGAKLELLCAACTASVTFGARFCKKCGTPLGASTATVAAKQSNTSPIRVAETPAPENLEGERKIVSALFADLKGSTVLMEDLDPEEAHAIVAPLLRIMTDAVERYEGHIARTTGDGIFALFGAPTAFEDHPQRALYAALEMQRELRAEGQRRIAQGLRALEARVGVHTGEVVAYAVETSGRVEYRLVGHAANLASRLESLAPVGSIATSEYTRNLCEGYFELRGLGPTPLKGLSTSIGVYEVIGLGHLRTRFQLALQRGLTKFIGREHELAQLRRALDQALSGHGQVVAVMAEAGTGKSRLLHEFRGAIPPTCKVLEAYSVSHGKASPWLPVLELLRNYFGITDTDDAASRREKVRNALTALDPALADTLPYLLSLLGIVEGLDPIAQMDPTMKRQRTLDAIKRIILRESLKQPVVVIFEDLQWIDAQTQALLDVLADGVARASVLLLVNYRPEYHHEWTNKSYYAQLRLDPLGSAEGTAMLAALLGEGVELNPLKRLITDRTGGNPLFIEEIVRALFDDGALTRNGVVKVTRSLSQVRLPPTVQGMLAARIGRLAAEQKDLLQTLAVIGRESSHRLLSKVVSRTDDQLDRMLADLQAAEFIYEQPAASDLDYVFKHALTQEVAYNELLIERRKQLHERTGQALETIFADHLDDHLSQLAHHYRHSDNADKAIEYLGHAGRQALQRSTHTDAIANTTSALEMLASFPETPERMRREIPLQLLLGQALIPAKGWAAPEVERPFARVQQICERLGDSPELFSARVGLWSVCQMRGLLRQARERAEELLRMAQSANSPSLMVMAHFAMGNTLLHLGELKVAREHQDLTVSLYDPDRDKQLILQLGSDVRSGTIIYAGWTLWYLGYPDRAIEKGKEALALAQELSHPNSVAGALFFDTIVGLLRREPKQVLASTELFSKYCEEHGLGGLLLFNQIHRGWALVHEGYFKEGIEQLVQSIAIAHIVGVDIGRTHCLRDLSEAYMLAGQIDDALDTVSEALACIELLDERFVEADIYRLKGELLLRHDGADIDNARRCFEKAIEIARKQSAKSWELRSTSSLARLLASQGDREEARTMLAEIYNWFTEGFDTPDLKDGKALLDELNR